MKPLLHKGQLVKWKDDRGFGFIKPDDSKKEVFLHISALKGAGRRPKVGDTIFYELVTQADGKVRASNASIHGVAVRPLPTKQNVKKRGLLETAIGIGFVAAILLFIFTSIRKPECNIKGNISISTGNKLYHLPGMEDYESTVIDIIKGERWFCSESEALAKGWRKAPR